jgi:hypothetical protein
MTDERTTLLACLASSLPCFIATFLLFLSFSLLQSIQFVSNVFFGKVMLGKRVTMRMCTGTALTVSGTVPAIYFSPKKGAEITDVSSILAM